MTARPVFLLAIICFAGFLSSAATADALHDPTGLWTGRLVTDQGTCDETRDTSTFQVGTKRITFTPSDGSIVLRGVPEKGNAHYHAEALVQQPSGAPFPMVFAAHPEGKTIVGTYGTPRCRAHIVLKR
ncbi:MAG: hypothetical protein ABF826_13935 [Komagataeibacter saccharivorans]|uniref:hypothetical protein n=1 Tax=Komagataeibacter saccharivorans TaxID=265959 RepID=UPI000E56CBB4|nr:hypothetical protein [Komagataeibacter saccharivorans]